MGFTPQLKELYIKMGISNQMNLGILKLLNNSSLLFLKGLIENCLICKNSVEVQPFKNKRNICTIYFRV